MADSLQQRFKEPADWHWGSMVNARGKNLRYGGSAPAGKPLAHIIYVEGLSEYAEKTFELARDFNKASCAFWVMDRQGQGLSDRSLSNRFKQHAVNIDDDAADLIAFARSIVPHDGAPIILQGHSAGGLLSVVAMHNAPDSFSGAVLTAPLLGLQNPVVKDREVTFSKLHLPQWLRENYPPGGVDWQPRESPGHHPKPADYTSDPDRMKIQDYWQNKNPLLRLGDATWGWVSATTRAITKTREPGYLSAFAKPVEIFTAGHDIRTNNDSIIRALAQFQDVKLHNFPQGKHELLMETDDIRQPIIDATIRMARRLAGPA